MIVYNLVNRLHYTITQYPLTLILHDGTARLIIVSSIIAGFKISDSSWCVRIALRIHHVLSMLLNLVFLLRTGFHACREHDAFGHTQ
jgi:hypothetical protein